MRLSEQSQPHLAPDLVGLALHSQKIVQSNPNTVGGKMYHLLWTMPNGQTHEVFIPEEEAKQFLAFADSRGWTWNYNIGRTA